MSGKAEGKKRNRAAQSEPHGYKESPSELADKTGGQNGGKGPGDTGEKQRTIDKIRDLERRRRERDETG